MNWPTVTKADYTHRFSGAEIVSRAISDWQSLIVRHSISVSYKSCAFSALSVHCVLFTGAFLIPYFGTLALVGLPLFYMELAFGQFASLGPIAIWSLNPLFKGKYHILHHFYHGVVLTIGSLAYRWKSVLYAGGELPLVILLHLKEMINLKYTELERMLHKTKFHMYAPMSLRLFLAQCRCEDCVNDVLFRFGSRHGHHQHNDCRLLQRHHCVDDLLFCRVDDDTAAMDGLQ